MATNPRIPSDSRDTGENRRPELVPPAPKRPGFGLPGVLFAILVAAALIAVIVYYMPRAPKKTPPPSAAQLPAQPGSNQLQFSNVHLGMAPTGGAMTLEGLVMNTSGRPVLGATVQASFLDSGGKVVGNVVQPLEGMVNKEGVLQSDSFGTDPLQPNATRPFRMTVSPVPAGWNHSLPNLTVLTVSAEGNR